MGMERMGSFDIDMRRSVIHRFLGLMQRDACLPFQFSVGFHFIVVKNNRGVLRASLIAHAAVVVRGSNLGELSILVNDHAILAPEGDRAIASDCFSVDTRAGVNPRGLLALGVYCDDA